MPASEAQPASRQGNTWGRLLADLLLGRADCDRAAELREPQAADRLAALPARYLVLDDRGRFAVVAGQPVQMVFAPLGPKLFLGVADGLAYQAVLVSDDVAGLPEGTGWESLRTIGAALDTRTSGLATTALALANWHATHPRCPRCGTPTDLAQAGWRRDCPADGSQHFPRTDPAVIALLIDADDCALLGRSARWPDGAYSTLAGFVEPGETAEAAVIREVGEEVGLVPTAVTYLGSQPWPFPASLMLGYHAYIAGHAPTPTVDGTEIVSARWVTRQQLPGLCESGEVRLPSEISIANRLVARWFGDRLPSRWCRW